MATPREITVEIKAEDRLAAVRRVLDGAHAIMDTLGDAVARLEPELEQLRAEVAALAVSRVQARAIVGEPTPELDLELARHALRPGSIVRPEHMNALVRVREAGRLRELLEAERQRAARVGSHVVRRDLAREAPLRDLEDQAARRTMAHYEQGSHCGSGSPFHGQQS